MELYLGCGVGPLPLVGASSPALSTTSGARSGRSHTGSRVSFFEPIDDVPERAASHPASRSPSVVRSKSSRSLTRRSLLDELEESLQHGEKSAEIEKMFH